eukprot:TRINITY_DN2651_c1_g1_i1.p1 TRINITY_DN2651_c1_g1~~TRINITY_DN2651_c1_g1_i1.p1  ORF type:complete len:224 (-),score=39.98 TRINITY_DN2651_c1_g1_i1:212-883(-)
MYSRQPIDAVIIPFSLSGCDLRLDSNYSLKFQNFLSRARFQQIVDTVNDIHKKYEGHVIISAVFMLIFAFLPCFCGVVAAIDFTLFFLYLIVSIVVLLIAVAWFLIAIFQRLAYRKKEMKNLCYSLGEEFPGSNWIYRTRGAGKQTQHYLEIEFPQNGHLASAPGTQFPISGENVYMPPQASLQATPLLQQSQQGNVLNYQQGYENPAAKPFVNPSTANDLKN